MLYMSRSVAGYLAFLLVTISLVAVARGQEAPASSSAEQSVATVTVPFFVEDRTGHPITIASSELTILDNKVPPKSVLSVKPASELPLRLGILIDKSGSQKESQIYKAALAAMSDLLRLLPVSADDRAFVVSFSSVPEASAFMTRDEAQKFHLDVTPKGGTALYDAVVVACEERMNTDDTMLARRILVLLSDGEDNASNVRLEKAISSALRAQTVIFAVSSDDGGHGTFERGDRTLKKLTEETGGVAFVGLKPKDIPKVFDKLKAEIAAMSSVTYIPAEPRKAGQFQLVDMHASEKRRVFFPRGYYTAAVTQ